MPSVASAATKTLPYKSAVLMDYETGQILLEENAHEQVIPASLVKMMVLLLAMEQLETGKIHLSDAVTASEWAAHMGGQQVHLAKGETFTLKELLDAMVIASANDAAVAVAEYLAGSVENCVKMMNARARAIGMNDTVFANVHGLPAGRGQVDDLTSAYDMALLGRFLLTHYPKILEWTSTYTAPFRDGEMKLVNTNKYLLRRVPGVDGLKTGYHRRAGFNVCVTARQDDRRVIAVVMGAPSKTDRNKKAKELLAEGLSN
jgi:D-alanyl-D-alanine carboxypeptidase (penicillin-binding protein 5/6)